MVINQLKFMKTGNLRLDNFSFVDTAVYKLPMVFILVCLTLSIQIICLLEFIINENCMHARATFKLMSILSFSANKVIPHIPKNCIFKMV